MEAEKTPESLSLLACGFPTGQISQDKPKKALL
jgi:hypothetical protein